jgi:hypothetical protein
LSLLQQSAAISLIGDSPLARLAADEAMKTRSLLGLKFTQCIVFAASIATSHADSDKSITAAQVNGTWKTKGGEFKIWALGKQRLQVEFSGVYEYKTPQGPMANEGEGSGVATIEGDTAIFKPEGAEEECQITLKFTGNKLVVTQTGICGFGHNVSAEGTYKKVSSKKPKFGSD